MKTPYVTAAVLALAMAGTGIWWMNQRAAPRPAEEIVVPELSAAALQGQIASEENCATCHGQNASGTDQGPPLVHPIYEPSHHADLSFLLATRNGVRAHHWPFGNMPPVEGVTDREVEGIVAYVRELQRANGIR